MVARDPTLGFAANFLYTLTGKKPDDVMERVFDIALTLHADHELNASTFAARVTAATLSDIYSAVTSGIGALKGPLHGGANEDVIKMLLEAGTAAKALDHVKYTPGEQDQRCPASAIASITPSDPRATHLRELSEELGKRTGHVDLYQTSSKIEEDHQGNQGPERERGFLFRVHLLFAGHSDRPVHADFRRQPHVRLDGARAGAISQQPPDPSARRIHGQARWARLGPDRRALRLKPQ